MRAWRAGGWRSSAPPSHWSGRAAAVAEWTAEASWQHVTLELVADGAPLAYGDHERLVQAAGNLVENALKHTPRDGSVGVRVWSTLGDTT